MCKNILVHEQINEHAHEHYVHVHENEHAHVHEHYVHAHECTWTCTRIYTWKCSLTSTVNEHEYVDKPLHSHALEDVHYIYICGLKQMYKYSTWTCPRTWHVLEHVHEQT